MSTEEMKTINGEVADAILTPSEPVVYTDKIQIHADGRKYKTLYTKKFKERKPWKEPDPNEIHSIIPGAVSSLLVKQGDKVKRGEKLMIYEAMKMQNVIIAPFDAEVELISVRIGDKLPKGTLLIRLKKEEPKVKEKKLKKKR